MTLFRLSKQRRKELFLLVAGFLVLSLLLKFSVPVVVGGLAGGVLAYLLSVRSRNGQELA